MDQSNTAQDRLEAESSQKLLLMSLLCDVQNKRIARRELLRRRSLRKYPDDQIADFLGAELEFK